MYIYSNSVLSHRNIIWATWGIYNFLVAIISQISFQHVILMKDTECFLSLTLFFLCAVFKIQWVSYTYSTCPFTIAAFQALESYTWAVAAIGSSSLGTLAYCSHQWWMPLPPATTNGAAMNILAHVPHGPFREFHRDKHPETGFLGHRGTMILANWMKHCQIHLQNGYSAYYTLHEISQFSMSFPKPKIVLLSNFFSNVCLSDKYGIIPMLY